MKIKIIFHREETLPTSKHQNIHSFLATDRNVFFTAKISSNFILEFKLWVVQHIEQENFSKSLQKPKDI